MIELSNREKNIIIDSLKNKYNIEKENPKKINHPEYKNDFFIDYAILLKKLSDTN